MLSGHGLSRFNSLASVVLPEVILGDIKGSVEVCALSYPSYHDPLLKLMRSSSGLLHSRSHPIRLNLVGLGLESGGGSSFGAAVFD